jgi:hypothetical protein
MTITPQNHAIRLIYQYHLGSVSYDRFRLQWAMLSWNDAPPIVWSAELMMYQYEDGQMSEQQLRQKLFDLAEEVEA